MRIIATVAALTIAAVLAACKSDAPAVSAAEASGPPSLPPQLRHQVSVMIGMDMAEQLGPIRDDVDLDIAFEAVREQLAGKAPRLSAAERDRVRREFGAHLRDKRGQERQRLIARNQQLADRFFATNTTRPGVTTTKSGLQYEVLREGTGPRPSRDDTVRVHYTGTHLDGVPFDNSYERDHPADIVLSQVMSGWSEGIALMPVGSKYRFWLPGKLAYGDNGKPGEIEPNTALIFEIELLEIAGHPLPAG